MHIHPLTLTFIKLCAITLSVYVAFKYLLPLVAPFAIAFMLMKLLMPIITFLRNKVSFPSWYAFLFTLVAFWTIVFVSISIICCQTAKQLRLLISNIQIYIQIYSNSLTKTLVAYCHNADYYFNLNTGTTYHFVCSHVSDMKNTYIDSICNNVSHIFTCCCSGIVQICTFLFIVIISMVVLCKDIKAIDCISQNSAFHEVFHKISHTLKITGMAYLKSQCIIIAANWSICSLGLFFIHNPYCIIIGLLISIVDAFPILGSGMILAPWGIYHIFRQNFMTAAVLFTTYVITLFVREILEARLIGNNMNMLPFFMLASIYIGIELFGLPGIILGPFGVILIRTLYDISS